MELKLLPTWRLIAIEDFDLKAYIAANFQELNEVTRSAFLNTVELQQEKFEADLSKATYLGLVEWQDKILAFCSLSLKINKTLNHKLVLWVNKIAIRPEAQGTGLVPRLVRSIEQISILNEVGYVGCCTQNTSLISSFLKMGYETYPITRSYGCPEGIGIWTYLTLNVDQIKDRLAECENKLDDLLICSDGILKKYYPAKINMSERVLTPEITEKLIASNYSEEEGDMLVLLTELNKN